MKLVLWTRRITKTVVKRTLRGERGGKWYERLFDPCIFPSQVHHFHVNRAGTGTVGPLLSKIKTKRVRKPRSPRCLDPPVPTAVKPLHITSANLYKKFNPSTLGLHTSGCVIYQEILCRSSRDSSMTRRCEISSPFSVIGSSALYRTCFSGILRWLLAILTTSASQHQGLRHNITHH